tara:strand:+ start:567 stop:977 length:411 start_codon:yes stop_codon:yes gene_type:complete
MPAVYKISHPDHSESYIGSTINLKNRVYTHRAMSKISNNKLYSFIKKTDTFNNFIFEILVEINCSKLELLKLEKKFIEILKPELNSNTPYLTKEESKQKSNEYKKEKKYCDICNCKISNRHFARHKKSKKHSQNLF